MQNYTVQFVFNATTDVILPLVYSISDPKEGDKSTIIPGTRGMEAYAFLGEKGRK